MSRWLPSGSLTKKTPRAPLLPLAIPAPPVPPTRPCTVSPPAPLSLVRDGDRAAGAGWPSRSVQADQTILAHLGGGSLLPHPNPRPTAETSYLGASTGGRTPLAIAASRSASRSRTSRPI